MRIAFFGGTFDPPHLGHLTIARAAADRLSLDRVLFAPVGSQPLKQDSSIAAFADRMAMVKLAVAGDPRYAASDIDAPRADGQPNYTIDTILRLKDTLNVEDRIFCLIGADSFLSLRHWYRAFELLFACEFIVAGRPGFDLADAEQSLSPSARIVGDPMHTPGLDTVKLTNDAGKHATLYFLPDLHEDISATELREALAKPGTPAQELPPSVAEYIQQHHLYRG
ncbi:nicotinate (nicotinamide) nucleotide adenylyltransferase [Acidobacterium sp. S8]|uniref:nicotinate (nicotinamide) nucleotide adenylyltransferase n=1 Tax=Acidobacterium sp. S8 TaxID=1641854 RepID=UPI00131E65E8|nr:nicotinate (nicotinamide) nucleotide adenylyltransferase [Acidobacterium sp. S8]